MRSLYTVTLCKIRYGIIEKNNINVIRNGDYTLKC